MMAKSRSREGETSRLCRRHWESCFLSQAVEVPGDLKEGKETVIAHVICVGTFDAETVLSHRVFFVKRYGSPPSKGEPELI